MATSTNTEITREAVLPAVRRIGINDLRAALSQGVDDFLAMPTQLVFLCILYPVIGLIAARAAMGTELLPLLFPLVAGMALVGPVAAVGLYELSRRRERGETVSWLSAFNVLRSPAILSITAVGVMLGVLFVAWLGTARLLFNAIMPGPEPVTIGALLAAVLDTRSGMVLLVAGNLVGFVFAVVVLVLTVVSVPMLLDRGGSPLTAMQTSIRAVRANPATMAVWGLVVAATLLLGCIPLFIGLAVAMPVLGHATWHLYRRVVV